jgi:hypothetical protein
VGDVKLVRDGYTVGSRTAAFGRVGERYVMRDNKGYRITLPIATVPDHLREVWKAFQGAAAGEESMPATFYGEIVESVSRIDRGAKSNW